MKRLLTICTIVTMTIAIVANAATLKDKEPSIFYSAAHYLTGQPIKVGYDIFGYNYQAHMFNGSYYNSYAGGAGFPPYEGDDDSYLTANPTAANHWAWPYRNVDLSMKWNDAWLSNQDNDGDGKLDRHYGYPTYTNSGAWLTNHMSGSDEIMVNDKLKKAHWTYFTKIVTPSDSANKVANVWYDADGVEIGPEIWGAFATVQTVENDPFYGIHGKQYGSPAGPGFGKYSPTQLDELVATGQLDPQKANDIEDSGGAAE
ncbi:MAG: hypothetical protein FVQ85_09325 [Planctomycetes bacterium]|nr:hypothetical protein [Planctomycetota bacterium]